VKLLVSAFLDPVSRSIAVRLTLASTLAMAIAAGMALHNPWWAAMAVWMIGQPSRGLLLERSLAQLVGTVFGTAAGAAIVLASPSLPVAAICLTVWIAICCGVANVMRHQRAYGAALCGLTSAVIVSLTFASNLDPIGFALARALDTFVGVGSAILVALAFDRKSATSTIFEQSENAVCQAMALIAGALLDSEDKSTASERAFLATLASLEASAEDSVAGSLVSRRKLRDLKSLFAFLLDLIVIARAVRFRALRVAGRDHAAILSLQQAFIASAQTLTKQGSWDPDAIDAASIRLGLLDPVLSPLLEEMRGLLQRAADGYNRLRSPDRPPAKRWSLPHPDLAGVMLAIVRGALASGIAGTAWLVIPWDEARYLVLGTCIFTVLFSAIDEPAALVKQVFIAGLAAALAAILWRLVVVPEIATPWISACLAIPLLFAASLLQARNGTMFIGLAFNMLFAVLARPVDLAHDLPSRFVTIEGMLLSGIALSYIFYRWLIPIDTKRRRGHIRASIRREITAISVRAATPWAQRHLARLRYLVLSLAVRSRGDIQESEDALAALSFGHALCQLGEMQFDPSISSKGRAVVSEVIRITSSPLFDPASAGAVLRRHAEHLAQWSDSEKPVQELEPRICWLLELAAVDIDSHTAIFAKPLRIRHAVSKTPVH
jgi:uncharacterized membrane protein YccC